jgi:hypothetical protein
MPIARRMPISRVLSATTIVSVLTMLKAATMTISSRITPMPELLELERLKERAVLLLPVHGAHLAHRALARSESADRRRAATGQPTALRARSHRCHRPANRCAASRSRDTGTRRRTRTCRFRTPPTPRRVGTRDDGAGGRVHVEPVIGAQQHDRIAGKRIELRREQLAQHRPGSHAVAAKREVTKDGVLANGGHIARQGVPAGARPTTCVPTM